MIIFAVLRLVHSHLSNAEKGTKPNLFSSFQEEILFGVPQESILDLFQTFSIFLYDVFLTMKDTLFESHAEDNSPYTKDDTLMMMLLCKHLKMTLLAYLMV